MGKEVSRKTRIILIACAAGFVAAAAAVLLGVLLTQLPKGGDNNPQVGKLLGTTLSIGHYPLVLPTKIFNS
jgi:hypothetical protein